MSKLKRRSKIKPIKLPPPKKGKGGPKKIDPPGDEGSWKDRGRKQKKASSKKKK